MKRTFKILILFYFLFTNFILFAQMKILDENPIIGGPGDEDNNGSDGLEGGDPDTVSINSKLWILIFLAIVYAYFAYKNKKRLNKETV
jgi:hypothetical protein